MRCGVIARKLGMSRIFNDAGEHVPVTVLRIEDVEVLSVKSIAKDGYTSVQLGFSNKKPKNIITRVIPTLRNLVSLIRRNPRTGSNKKPMANGVGIRKSIIFLETAN